MKPPGHGYECPRSMRVWHVRGGDGLVAAAPPPVLSSADLHLVVAAGLLDGKCDARWLVGSGPQLQLAGVWRVGCWDGFDTPAAGAVNGPSILPMRTSSTISDNICCQWSSGLVLWSLSMMYCSFSTMNSSADNGCWYFSSSRCRHPDPGFNLPVNLNPCSISCSRVASGHCSLWAKCLINGKCRGLGPSGR